MTNFLIVAFFIVVAVVVIYIYVETFCEIKHRRWMQKDALLGEIDKMRAIQTSSEAQRMWDMFYEYIKSYGEDSTD